MTYVNVCIHLTFHMRILLSYSRTCAYTYTIHCTLLPQTYIHAHTHTHTHMHTRTHPCAHHAAVNTPQALQRLARSVRRAAQTAPHTYRVGQSVRLYAV